MFVLLVVVLSTMLQGTTSVLDCKVLETPPGVSVPGGCDWTSFMRTPNHIGAAPDGCGPYTAELGVIWERKLDFEKEGRRVTGQVLVKDGRCFFTTYDDWAHKTHQSRFICLNAYTGVKIWDFLYDSKRPRDNEHFYHGTMGTPILYKDKVLFNTCYGGVYCLDQKTGGLVWGATFENKSPEALKYSKPGDLKGTSVGSMVADGDNIFIDCNFTFKKRFDKGKYRGLILPVAENSLFKLDPSNGTIIGTNTIQAYCFDPNIPPYNEAMGSTPAIYDGKVYWGHLIRVTCADVSTVQTLWSMPVTTDYPRFSSPAVVDGRLYYGTYCRDFFCLDAKTGKIIWRTPLKYNVRCTTCPPCLQKQSVLP